MPKFQVTRQAHRDLEQIDDYVAEDNPRAADQLIEDLFAAMKHAASEPEHAGVRRTDLTDRDVRFMLVRRHYWLVYVVTNANQVIIVRVLHARRDILNIL